MRNKVVQYEEEISSLKSTQVAMSKKIEDLEYERTKNREYMEQQESDIKSLKHQMNMNNIENNISKLGSLRTRG